MHFLRSDSITVYIIDVFSIAHNLCASLILKSVQYIFVYFHDEFLPFHDCGLSGTVNTSAMNQTGIQQNIGSRVVRAPTPKSVIIFTFYFFHSCHSHSALVCDI